MKRFVTSKGRKSKEKEMMGFLQQGRQQLDTAVCRTVKERQCSSRVIWRTFQQSKARRSVINMSADEKNVDWQV